MPATGRRPYDTSDIAPYGVGTARLRPPASLGELEKQRFLDLITTTPAGQFRASDLPLLCRWAELTVMAETAAGELAAGGMVTADGKVSPWFSIYTQATKALSGLALRLKVSPQARAPKAPKRDVSVSYYERLELEAEEAQRGEDGKDG
jgi:DNA-binding PucR family transcriptional regulator